MKRGWIVVNWQNGSTARGFSSRKAAEQYAMVEYGHVSSVSRALRVVYVSSMPRL